MKKVRRTTIVSKYGGGLAGLAAILLSAQSAWAVPPDAPSAAPAPPGAPGGLTPPMSSSATATPAVQPFPVPVPAVSATGVAPAQMVAPPDNPPPFVTRSDLSELLQQLMPTFHGGFRVGGTIQGATHDQFNGLHLDTVYLEPRFFGTVNKWVSWQVMFNANAGTYATSSVLVMDAVAKFHFDDAFNIYLGHMLTPSDRSTPSGSFGIIPWNYPGFYGGKLLVGSVTGAYGRDTGGVVWGQLWNGKVEYYLGGLGLEQTTTNPEAGQPIERRDCW